jgi:hypothetical protein
MDMTFIGISYSWRNPSGGEKPEDLRHRSSLLISPYVYLRELNSKLQSGRLSH